MHGAPFLEAVDDAGEELIASLWSSGNLSKQSVLADRRTFILTGSWPCRELGELGQIVSIAWVLKAPSQE